MSDGDLQVRQKAAAIVEKRMLDFLLQYTPCGDLTVHDVQTIAAHARQISFDVFSDPPRSIS